MGTEEARNESPPEEKNPKRRMKTPSQLEVLEKVYAEEKYPSETVRAGLSAQLELSDRQLQMWFCHRRLKDRKVKEDETPPPPPPAGTKQLGKEKEPVVPAVADVRAHAPSISTPEIVDSAFLAGNCYANSFALNPAYVHRDATVEGSKGAATVVVKRPAKETESSSRKKSHQGPASIVDPHRALEMQAIAAVEAQLGEPLREDGPILGLEFDPLPPGAFGTPIAPAYPKHTASQPPMFQYESKTPEWLSKPPEWQESKHHKMDHHSGHGGGKRRKVTSSSLPGSSVQPASRAVREYQFIPEQPTGRTEHNQTYERSNQSKLYSGTDNSPYEAVPSTSSFLQGNESSNPPFSYQGRISNSCGRSSTQAGEKSTHSLHRNGVSFDGFQDPFVGYGYSDGQFGSHQAPSFPLSPGAPIIAADRMESLQEQEQLRLERKRKCEELRIAKEVEANEKRIKREIEKQELAKRKREEQLRKELEKQSREKQRELERVLREKQREEERVQREQKREIERRDKLIQKENIRIERQQMKDAIRRQKEASKMKAALERAAARRMARESVELIDDERLELLEAAAASQGLPSIYLLDGETLQGLDRFEGFLKKFPPASVTMKKPLSAQPWIESMQNVNSLLMVWRFITNFADVLDLWPFTIDEFAQAFHDYDPRLLGEVHIALLKTLVKDIEDVTHASANGVAVNQYTLSFTGGGHPQLVESAFAWGFDIREWHQHLNPLTWPEILRQFALSAGYGPKWKKQKPEIENISDENEGNDGEEAVNALRSGSAVTSAFVQMRGKGGHGRRKRNRLTPGTVKYAAFHVLATVGSKGLTITEAAERIQKSGLRDLSTSRTPEASIAAALSRDNLLFERVAPSTYCVRSVYRKNPEDAEILLEAARERIRAFQNEAEDGEKDTEDVDDAEDGEKDMEDLDEAEREEDYDEDVDDVENFEIGESSTVLKTAHIPCSEKERTQMAQLSGEIGNQSKPGLLTNAASEMNIDKHGVDSTANLENGSTDFEKTQIDESHMGEPWIQGLMEGEYSDLSVEERLNALVALVDIVNEGNTIRLALEERLEAANALKRQLWLEAQIDRRRSKEDQLTKSHLQIGDGIKSEQGIPSANEDQENGVEKVSEGIKPDDHWTNQVQSCQLAQVITANVSVALDKSSNMLGASGQDVSILAQAGFPNEKTRAQLKTDIGLRAEGLFVYRSLPLGSDRRHNRYWIFSTCNSGEDPGCGRLYVEFHEDGHWEVIGTEEALDALMTSLDTRGIREANLHNVIQKYEDNLREGMRKMSSAEDGRESSQGAGVVSIECGNSIAERQHAQERYGEFDKWLWSACMKGSYCLNALKFGKRRNRELLSLCDVCHDLYSLKDKHCSYCHATFEWSPKFEAKFSQHLLDCEERCKRKGSDWRPQGPIKSLPSRIQLLKAEIVALEAMIPAEALKPSTWKKSRRKTWAAALKKSSSSRELLQALTDLESVINRDWLSSLYETSEDLLKTAFPEDNRLGSLMHDGPTLLPWVPRSTAAVAFRLRMFDAALSFSLEQKHQKVKQAEVNTVRAEVMATVKMQKIASEDDSVEEEPKTDSVLDSSTARPSGRGRGGRVGRPRGRGRGRGRGGRSDNNENMVESSSTAKVSRRKLHFLEGSGNDSNARAPVERKKRGRGRGRGGRSGGRGSTGRGRGRGLRSVRCKQNESEINDRGTPRQKKKTIAKPVMHDEIRIESPSEGSFHNDAWEAARDYEDADDNANEQNQYANELSASDAAGEPDEVEQVVEDEFEEEYEGHYEEDNTRDGDSGEDEISVELEEEDEEEEEEEEDAIEEEEAIEEEVEEEEAVEEEEEEEENAVEEEEENDEELQVYDNDDAEAGVEDEVEASESVSSEESD